MTMKMSSQDDIKVPHFHTIQHDFFKTSIMESIYNNSVSTLPNNRKSMNI